MQKQDMMQSLSRNLTRYSNVLNNDFMKIFSTKINKITFYMGKEETSAFYKKTLSAIEVYSFVNLDNYYEVFPGTREMFLEAFIVNKRRKVYDITVNTPLAHDIRKDHTQYFAKLLPPKQVFYGFDYFMFDGNIALISLDKKNPGAFLIRDRKMFDEAKMVFLRVWNFLSE